MPKNSTQESVVPTCSWDDIEPEGLEAFVKSVAALLVDASRLRHPVRVAEQHSFRYLQALSIMVLCETQGCTSGHRQLKAIRRNR